MLTYVAILLSVAVVPAFWLVQRDLEAKGRKSQFLIIILFIVEVSMALVVGLKQAAEDDEFDGLYSTVRAQTNEIAGLSNLARVQRDQLIEFRNIFHAIPGLPEISLTTQDGLPVPLNAPGTVGPKEQELFRWHTLEVRNTNKINLSSVRVELLLPEPIFEFYKTQSTAGLTVSLEPRVATYVGRSINGGSMTQTGGRRPIRHFDVKIGLLPATGFLRLEILTVSNSIARLSAADELFVQGDFLFESDKIVQRKLFYAPLTADPVYRKVSLGTNVEVTGLAVHEEM